MYIVDENMSPALLLKKASNLGLGGWWLGGTHMKPNPGFIGAVQQKVPKDAKLIVTCQKGLRCGLSFTNTIVAKLSGVIELLSRASSAGRHAREAQPGLYRRRAAESGQGCQAHRDLPGGACGALSYRRLRWHGSKATKPVS